MWEASISAAQNLFSPGPLLGMLIVLPIALFSGLMPGGGLPVAAVVLSFAGHLDPWIAITVVVFHMAASDITEPVPAILMGIPGSRSAQATILDGYPMARKGLAGVALGASYTTTLVGGLIGALALLAALPLGRELLRMFGSAEFFLLSLMGILAVAVVSAGAFVKGMLTAAFGLAIAMIGFTNLGGFTRATLGIDYLWDGVKLVPLVIGLFAIPEAIDLVVGNTPIARERLDVMIKEANRDVLRGMREAFNHKWLMVRSSLIGVFVGIMPGLGGGAAHWMAYVQARQTEKGGVESFGKGDVRGVIAADAANNSVDGGVLIPTVMFGIPGSAPMALVLAILIMSGIHPGPSMLGQHLDLTISMVYTIALGNVVVVPIMLAFAPWLIRLTAIPPNILAPVVMGVVTLAAFQATSSMADLVLTLAFGGLGVFMKWYGWPRPPILIAVALADILERYLWISMNTYGFAMLLRPPALAILALLVLTIIYTFRIRSRTNQTIISIALTDESPRKEGLTFAPEQLAAQPEQLRHEHATAAAKNPRKISWDSVRRYWLSIEVLGEVFLLLLSGGLFLYLLIESFRWPDEAAKLMPRLAVAIGAPFWLMRLFAIIRRTKTVAKEIMDVGFRIGMDPEAEIARFTRICLFILTLYLSIWLVGFHVALPIGISLYVLIYGRAGWLLSSIIGLGFLAVIVGLYDLVLHTAWHKAIVARLLGFN